MNTLIFFYYIGLCICCALNLYNINLVRTEIIFMKEPPISLLSINISNKGDYRKFSLEILPDKCTVDLKVKYVILVLLVYERYAKKMVSVKAVRFVAFSP